MKRAGEDGALKPIGLALTAVVAGLGVAAAHAPVAADAARVREHAPDASLDPARDEDPSLVFGASEPVEPFSERAAPLSQPDLFEL